MLDRTRTLTAIIVTATLTLGVSAYAAHSKRDPSRSESFRGIAMTNPHRAFSGHKAQRLRHKTTRPRARRGERRDKIAPETAIIFGPSGTIPVPASAFAFSASEVGSTFECRLDEADWHACSSPEALSALTDDRHTFAVRAIDMAHNVDPTPAVRSFAVDVPSDPPAPPDPPDPTDPPAPPDPPVEPAPVEPAPIEPSPGMRATVASAEAIPVRAYHLSPDGSDSNSGTADQPWRTIQKAISAVAPGDTVVLHSGTYGARGTTHIMKRPGTASAPITFRGASGEAMPRILGFFKITASYQRFSYMLFDGPTGPVKTPTTSNPTGEEVQVSILGDSVNGIEISHSEIRNSDWHAGLFLSGANDALILNNYIHDNGDETDPGQENQSHGIYWSSGSGLIQNNVIEHNLARGVQLYKHPTAVTITNNTIVKNGKAGIQFARETTNSLAVNNVVAYNEWGIRSAGLTGSGNVVLNNVVWENRSGNFTMADGLTLSANRTVDARFIGSTDYRLQAGSPAIDTASTAHAPADDFRLRARPLGAGPDLGAYESR